MKMDREEFMEYIRKTDLVKIVAVDISIFSKSINTMICGRIQQVAGGSVTIHTGIDFQYTVDVGILGNQRMDIFFVKDSKIGVEYISEHISFYTKDPCTDIIEALLDKIRLDGGTPRRMFPNRKLVKFLGKETTKVRDEEEDDEDYNELLYGYGMGWPGGVYDNPYTSHQSFSREKKFYFKECGRKAIISK